MYLKSNTLSTKYIKLYIDNKITIIMNHELFCCKNINLFI